MVLNLPLRRKLSFSRVVTLFLVVGIFLTFEDIFLGGLYKLPQIELAHSSLCEKCLSTGGICAQKDKRNQLRILLEEWKRILLVTGIDSFLGYGTLLASYREGFFMPWDHDLDVVVLSPETLKLENYFEAYNVNSSVSAEVNGTTLFRLVVQPEWMLQFQTDGSNGGRQHHDYPVHLVAPNARLYDLNNYTHPAYLDIWAMYCTKINLDETNKAMNSCSHLELLRRSMNNTEPGTLYNNTEPFEYATPLQREAIFPLKRCSVDGVQDLLCPQSPEIKLEAVYGNSFRTPDHFHSSKTGCWEKIQG
jgi:hypothetical protein